MQPAIISSSNCLIYVICRNKYKAIKSAWSALERAAIFQERDYDLWREFAQLRNLFRPIGRTPNVNNEGMI